ncbi:MAG TPA: hypothetical protein VFO16_08820 [Pseudonocardiaceae bacterium]|nr:hypothetical protein [Pseudonocardiaceae bacterium]
MLLNPLASAVYHVAHARGFPASACICNPNSPPVLPYGALESTISLARRRRDEGPDGRDGPAYRAAQGDRGIRFIPRSVACE